MKKRQMLLCVTATSVVAVVACHGDRLGEPAEMGKIAPALVTADADTRIGRIAADQPDAATPPHPLAK